MSSRGAQTISSTPNLRSNAYICENLTFHHKNDANHATIVYDDLKWPWEPTEYHKAVSTSSIGIWPPKLNCGSLLYEKFNFVVETRMMAHFVAIREQNKLCKWTYKLKSIFDPLLGYKGVKIDVAPLFYEKCNFVVETHMVAHFVAIGDQNKLYKWIYKLQSIFDPLVEHKRVKIAVAPLFYEKCNFIVETRMMAHFVPIGKQNKLYK